jgi:hypothetical protein
MSTSRFGAFGVGLLYFCAAAMPAAAQGDTDACTLLTPGQVGSAVGVAVGAGAHVTPTFVQTCTWTASGSNVKYVTLSLQTAAEYDGGKQMASGMAAAVKNTAMTSAGVGEDSYYFVLRDQVGLEVKKGTVSFKVEVYATLPVANKEAMELALAKEVLKKL